MVLDRLDRQTQLARDQLVGLALQQQREDVLLARGQTEPFERTDLLVRLGRGAPAYRYLPPSDYGRRAYGPPPGYYYYPPRARRSYAAPRRAPRGVYNSYSYGYGYGYGF